MKKTLLRALSVCIIATVLARSSIDTASAQAAPDVTLHMRRGEKRTVSLPYSDTAGGDRTVRVYKDDGGWGDQHITARARFIGSGTCQFDLSIVANDWSSDSASVRGTGLGEVSDWATLWGAGSEYIGGSDLYKNTESFDVTASRFGSCYEGQVEVEIWLVDSEPPPEQVPPPQPPESPPQQPPAPAPPSPATEATFYADDYQLDPGQCTTLHWRVENGTPYWENEVAPAYARTGVCPTETTVYTLEIMGADGQWHNEKLTVNVASVPPPAPPRAPATGVQYWADDPQLDKPGDCTNLTWHVAGAQSVTWEGMPTGPDAMTQVCPQQTRAYRLKVTGLDGTVTEQDVTVEVASVPVPFCDGFKTNYILILTDSRRLNASIGSSNAWAEDLRPRLEALYTSAANGCTGRPYFLDLSEAYGSLYAWQQVRPAIEAFANTRMEGVLPGAVAIIGGPHVVPMGVLRSAADDQLIPTDDPHVNFDNDERLLPDVPVTRLPDGSSLALLVNYIVALQENREPPAGTTIYSDLVIAREETYLGTSAFPTLRDLLSPQGGDFTVLLAPPWSDLTYRADVRSMGIGARLISPSDYWNFAPPAGSVGLLNVKNMIFNMTGHNLLGWGIRDPVTKQFRPVFTLDSVAHIPGNGGWHIFSLVSRSAEVGTHGQTAENSIPLQFLKLGAHHFIGSTTDNYFSMQDCEDPSRYGMQIPICHYSLQTCAGRLAQAFYRLPSGDPATSLQQAKLAASGSTRGSIFEPCTEKALHSFQYFGLPEPGPGLGIKTPVSWVDDRALLPEMPIRCPSGDRRDCDADGLQDAEETWVANTFTPTYLQAINEEVPLENVIYEVTLRQDQQGRQIVVFTSARLYKMDYIPGNLGGNNFSHFGDSEPVEIWLRRQPGLSVPSYDPYTEPRPYYAVYPHDGTTVLYTVDRVTLHLHGESEKYTARLLPNFGWDGTHIELYISEGKHAAYRTRQECDASPKSDGGAWDTIKKTINKGYWHEVCSWEHESRSMDKAVTPRLPITLNVGERNLHANKLQPEGHFFTTMAENPLLADVFPDDRVWGDDEEPDPLRFCGGYRLNPPDWNRWAALQTCDRLPDDWPINPQAEACMADDILIDLIGRAFLDEKLCGGAIEAKWCGGQSTRYCGGMINEYGLTDNELDEIQY